MGWAGASRVPRAGGVAGVRWMVRLAVVLALVLWGLAGSAAGTGSTDVAVLLDGLPVPFDVPARIIDGRTMVPFRAIAEALHLDVSWEPSRQLVLAVGERARVLLQVGHATAYINGLPHPLDVAPVIVGGRTLIPLRFLTEAFGCRVEWTAATRTVTITSPPLQLAVIGFYALGDEKTSSWTDLFGAAFPAMAGGHTDLVSELALGWYTIDAQGNLLTWSPRTAWQRPPGWEAVLDAARQFSLRTEMVVHETDAGGLLSAVLGSEESVARAAHAIAQAAARYDGVNLNFEKLGLYAQGEEQRRVQERFTRLVATLSPLLRAAGRTLTLTLHPPNSSFRGYDYPALGLLADRIIVMAHDYGPRPEPLDRVVQAIELAVASVPRDRLVLGISIPSETAESLITKVGVAKRHRLQGISLWRLGLLTDDEWAALRETVAPRP